MKNRERQPNGAVARAVVSTETLDFNHSSNQPKAYSYSVAMTVTKVLEESTKIGRRFSFDDNGGGYQGL